MKSLPQFAQDNDISTRTAYREIHRGVLEAVKVGRLTRITAEAEQSWKDSLPRLELQGHHLRPVDKRAV
jgi:excisionase family DNA binding protein